VTVRIIGIPGDRFVDHGSVSDLRTLIRLDSAGIAEQIRETLAALRAAPRGSRVRRSEATSA
jgi:deoxyxylulose-5-phosphate synthase